MSKALKRLLCGMVFLAAIPWASRAVAQPVETAADRRVSKLLQDIEEHLVERRYREAIIKMENLYRLRPNTVVLFNIAVATEKLENACGDIISAYSRLLSRCRECPQRDAAETRLLALTARCPFGTLEVRTVPPGIALVIDGEGVGESPLATILEPGEHSVGVASAQGPLERTFKLEFGAHKSLEFQVETVAAQSADSNPSDESPTVSASAGTSPTDAWAWSLVAGGGVLAGLGGYVAQSAAADESELLVPGGTTRADYDGEIESIRTQHTLGWTMAILGAGAALGGVWLMVSDSKSGQGGQSEDGAELGAALGPHGVYVRGVW